MALARARTCPHGAVVWPSSEPESVTPAPNASEEMALRESGKVSWLHVGNGPFIDFTIRNQPRLNQFAQPRRRERVVFVVVGGHLSPDADFAWILSIK